MNRFYGLLLCSLLAACASQTTTTTEVNPEWDPAKRADVHAQLAVQYMERDQLAVALEEVNQALAIDPRHSRSNYVMAVLQTRLKEYDKVNTYYQRALKYDPNNSEAAHDYGVFLCNEGKVDQALKYFEQALANPLYTGTISTNVRAGECLVNANKQRDRAERFFEAALAVNPEVPAALYYMADIKYDSRNYLSARGFIERFFSVSPETAGSLLLAAKIETQLGATDIAAEYGKRLKAKFPTSEEARQYKGM